MSVPPITDAPTAVGLSPKVVSDLVVAHLAELDAMAPESLIRVADLVRGFANYLAASLSPSPPTIPAWTTKS